jgi:N-acylneuraminate cytidylyltransferase
MNVAVIPARGGSKRIPKKNIRPFAGKPIIAYAIEAAMAAEVFDRIIVSTDSEEIAAVAREWGAETPFVRPAELADDMAGTAPVLVHAIHWLREHGERHDRLCCIYPTAPFVLPEDLRRGLDILTEQGARTAFSVTSFAYPIHRALYVDLEGRLKMFWPENLKKRSQDLPEAVHDAGQFYWVDVERFLADPELFGDDAAPVHLPRWRVQDIDTPEDWEMAERMGFSLQING